MLVSSITDHILWLLIYGCVWQDSSLLKLHLVFLQVIGALSVDPLR